MTFKLFFFSSLVLISNFAFKSHLSFFKEINQANLRLSNENCLFSLQKSRSGDVLTNPQVLPLLGPQTNIKLIIIGPHNDHHSMHVLRSTGIAHKTRHQDRFIWGFSDRVYVIFALLTMSINMSFRNEFESSSWSLRSYLSLVSSAPFHASHYAPVAHGPPNAQRNSFAESQTCDWRGKML